MATRDPSGSDRDRASRPTNQFRRNPFVAPVEPGVRPKRSSLEAVDKLVKAEDLSVVFQPIVHMDSLAVFAYEALVRCRAPGFEYPPKLFERAVQDKCTGRLGRMIREVGVPLCSGFPLFVNLHPAELAERWLVRPDDPIFQHDHDVYLEITESMPLTHFELCRDVLNEVRSRGGFHLVVDDLGAGYSNLKRIADLSPKVVKLDRELVAGVTRGSRQQQLVHGVVGMCRGLGADVVVEGVETVEEYRTLRETGAKYGQGYFFARPGFPLPRVDPAALLAR